MSNAASGLDLDAVDTLSCVNAFTHPMGTVGRLAGALVGLLGLLVLLTHTAKVASPQNRAGPHKIGSWTDRWWSWGDDMITDG